MSAKITGAQIIQRERARQIAKGYTTEQDVHENTMWQMRRAALAFEQNNQLHWPWDPHLFHPRGALWNLARAGAMYLAAEQMAKYMSAEHGTGWPAERERIEGLIDRLLWEVDDLYATLESEES